jgi:acyl dehydratase
MTTTAGMITDAELERIRERIGHGFEGRRPWRTEVTKDAAYHLAVAIGDMNPLYIDEDYAGASPAGGLLAPSIMLNSMDTLRAPGSAGLPQGLPGVHSIWTGSSYNFERALRVGDVVSSRSYLKDVVEVESGFAGGRAVYQTYEALYFDQSGAPLGSRRDTWIRNERQKTRQVSKYESTPIATWTSDQIEEIFAGYAAEKRTVRRSYADIAVGDELGVLTKGPLTPTAEIAFESFFGIYLVGNSLAVDLYRRHPALMIPNEQGVPEPPQRVHWDAEFTKNTLGLPGAYDIGLERCAWLINVMTNWMGETAYVRSIDVQYRRFNYMGDVTYNKGRVTGLRRNDGQQIVDVEVWCENHRGEISARGKGQIAYA